MSSFELPQQITDAHRMFADARIAWTMHTNWYWSAIEMPFADLDHIFVFAAMVDYGASYCCMMVFRAFGGLHFHFNTDERSDTYEDAAIALACHSLNVEISNNVSYVSYRGDRNIVYKIV